ncbi:M4 family metallopeptidase [Nocardioides sp.]|uniref:M4 family metallopeptidase n=1 Tax=Nocardioides sp. TaxID=35761 RepID=UPI003D1195E8
MGKRARVVVGVAVTMALASATLSLGQGTASSSPPQPADPAGIAGQRLAADSEGALTLDRGRDGRVVFAGAGKGSVDNPAVNAGLGVEAAASAHLTRYGPAFGTAGSTFDVVRTTHTVSGQDVVRYAQSIDGVPVIGGDVVVSLRPDRQLGSMLGSLTPRASVGDPAVNLAAAQRAAIRAAAKALHVAPATLTATSQGRWIFDPAIFGAAAPQGAHTVWRMVVDGGVGVRRLVLIDDRTGGVRLNLDDLQHADRVVCDRNNVRAAAEPCAAPFARTEGSGPSGVPEVNSAFELSGEVSDYYDQIGGIDLTDLLGITVSGVKKLASTVRFCYPVSNPNTNCPLNNAFWDGTQMYYGDGYAGADDVVGHEMTHGVIDHNSELFYWGQSGAINESIADIMGEILDHRYVSVGDSAGDWRLGEDLPIGAIRDLETPGDFGQPDRMTSPDYTADLNYGDAGGVHTNSGVGNKTAYLISQGGTFNGQSVTGIDTEAGLTKTATLYLDVIQSLTSGSDYADLARVLEQSCADLVGTHGFTSADCTAVHTATLATELRTTPTQAPQPPSATAPCPAGTTKRVLFDSETGTPATKFVAGSTWTRVPDGLIQPNATSGRTSWFSYDPSTITTSALVTRTGLALPKGQQSYLWFQHWRLLDYFNGTYFDGGTVEIDDVATAGGAVSAAGLPWVNGPTQPITAIANKVGFGGDSFGWIASRVNLSSYAGKTIKPRFTMHTDSTVEYYGWFLDDVRVYTCDLPKVSNTKKPTIAGTAKVGKKLTARPGTWKPAGVHFTYRWLRNGKAIARATARTYVLKAADRGKRISVKVTGTKAGYRAASALSARTPKVK